MLVLAIALSSCTVVMAKTWESKVDGGTWKRGFTDDDKYIFSRYTKSETNHGASTKGGDTYPNWKRVCAKPDCFAESTQKKHSEQDHNDFAYHPNCSENH
ncbi:MAG: lactococcin 972 family bacteriocin [Bacteroidales bacterium]|nr:lactococcin 972 family bacteriocin [Bacteroidales bacterium]